MHVYMFNVVHESNNVLCKFEITTRHLVLAMYFVEILELLPHFLRVQKGKPHTVTLIFDDNTPDVNASRVTKGERG